jgi:hypothetical protein
MDKQEKPLYSLMTLETFKGILGIDDRESNLAQFCLVTGTHTIEQYCKRRLIKKRHFEIVEFYDDLLLPLREYPVRKILAAFLMNNEQVTNNKEKRKMKNEKRINEHGKLIEPEFYELIPDCGSDLDIPFTVKLSPAILRIRGLRRVKVVYQAGYVVNPHPCGFTTSEFAMQTPAKALKKAASRGEPSPLCGSIEYTVPHVPPDLASACLELASWNMNRYRGRLIGMTGNVRGTGKDGEHFEMSMPENVRTLLEPYRRKTI